MLKEIGGKIEYEVLDKYKIENSKKKGFQR